MEPWVQYALLGLVAWIAVKVRVFNANLADILRQLEFLARQAEEHHKQDQSTWSAWHDWERRNRRVS